ncbi:MAG: hypothetical protein ACK5XS_08470 [Armatimonadota bacterium]|jgi:hypothetical protein|nr:hypothetical protein [Fimbriimonadaceae bacterium]
MTFVACTALLALAQQPASADQVWDRGFDTVLAESAKEQTFGQSPVLAVGPRRVLLIDFADTRAPMGLMSVQLASLDLTVLGTRPTTLNSVRIVRRPWGQDEANWSLAQGTRKWQRGGAEGSEDSQDIPGVTMSQSPNGVRIEGLRGAVQEMIDHPFNHYGLAIEFGQQAEIPSFESAQGYPRLEVKASWMPPAAVDATLEEPKLQVDSTGARRWSVTVRNTGTDPLPAGLISFAGANVGAISTPPLGPGATQEMPVALPANSGPVVAKLDVAGDTIAQNNAVRIYPMATPAVGAWLPHDVRRANEVGLPTSRTAYAMSGSQGRLAHTALMIDASIPFWEMTPNRDRRADFILPPSAPRTLAVWDWPEESPWDDFRTNVLPNDFAAWLHAKATMKPADLDKIEAGPTTLIIDLRDASNQRIEGAKVMVLNPDQGAEVARTPNGLFPISRKDKQGWNAEGKDVPVTVTQGGDVAEIAIDSSRLLYERLVTGQAAAWIHLRANLSDRPVDRASDLTQGREPEPVDVPQPAQAAFAVGMEGRVTEVIYDISRDRQVGGITFDGPAPLRMELRTRRTGEPGTGSRWIRIPHVSQIAAGPGGMYAARSVQARYVYLRAVWPVGATPSPMRVHPIAQAGGTP